MNDHEILRDGETYRQAITRARLAILAAARVRSGGGDTATARLLSMTREGVYKIRSCDQAALVYAPRRRREVA